MKPATAIEITQSGLFDQSEFKWGVKSETGVILRDETPPQVWLKLTEEALLHFEYHGKGHAKASMYVADLLNWGEDHPDIGEQYAQAINGARAYLQVKEKTISNNRWVLRAVPVSRRREGITSMGIYEAVAKLKPEEQSKYLQLADEESMTVRELRAKIAEEHPKTPVNASGVANGASVAKSTFRLDMDDPAHITQALNMLADHVSNPEAKTETVWKEPMGVICRVYRKVWMNNGKAKK